MTFSIKVKEKWLWKDLGADFLTTIDYIYYISLPLLQPSSAPLRRLLSITGQILEFQCHPERWVTSWLSSSSFVFFFSASRRTEVSPRHDQSKNSSSALPLTESCCCVSCADPSSPEDTAVWSANHPPLAASLWSANPGRAVMIINVVWVELNIWNKESLREAALCTTASCSWFRSTQTLKPTKFITKKDDNVSRSPESFLSWSPEDSP